MRIKIMLHRTLATLSDQNGATAVITALVMVALLGLAALSVDIGYVTLTKTQLQTAADQGALAGARNLIPGSVNSAQSIADAKAFATKNPGKVSDVVPDPVITVNGNTSTIQVTTSRTIPTFFARVLNKNLSNTWTASATARVGVAGSMPPGCPPYAIQAPSDIEWQGPNNMYSQQYTMEIDPAGQKDHFTYVDVFFWPSVGRPMDNYDHYYDRYIQVLTNGCPDPVTMNTQLYWLAEATGSKDCVEAYQERLSIGNSDINKAQVGDARLMMIPLLETLPTSAQEGNNWNLTTKNLKITGFVGFWLEDVELGPLTGTKKTGYYYKDFKAYGRFIKVTLPAGGATVPGGQFFGTYSIQLIK